MKIKRRGFMAGALAAAAIRGRLANARSTRGFTTLAVAGDSVITRRVKRTGDSKFGAVARLLRECDVAIASCAMTFSDSSTLIPAPKGIDLNLLCTSTGADDLAWMGLDLMSCASNHALDYGAEGLSSTLRNLERVGINVAGAGDTLTQASNPSYADAPTGRVALIGCATTFPESWIAADPRPDFNGRPGINGIGVDLTYRLPSADFEELKRIGHLLVPGARPLRDLVPGSGALLESASESDNALTLLDRKFVRGEAGIDAVPRASDMKRLTEAIEMARRRASIVCVMLHEHGNYDPGTFLQKMARDCIEAGADCFVVSGSHVFGGVEVYRGKAIVYGLGNFFFEYDTLPRIPAEVYQAYGFDPQTRDSSRVFNAISERYFDKEPKYWESGIVRLRFDESRLTALEVHPIALGLGEASFERGAPRLASPTQAASILARIARASEPYGTTLSVKDSVGSFRF
ncbi:MAG: CapA family protein [Gammaproteobacteria bacterium]